MIGRTLHILCSLWLVALLLFGSTPAEVIHAFAHHKDTIHCHDSKGPIIDSRHHHCQFLGFHLMPFTALPDLRIAYQPTGPEYLLRLEPQDERATQQIVALREGRGPPMA
jgi:hypothetical protein